ncbi:sortase [Candidatus Saccharibacteria bacterium]|nr:sortase [Candidatus Saccharibacteria bacterium]
MSSDSDRKISRDSSGRPQPGRPPIAWPQRSTPPTDNDRAADIARRHVERTYLKEEAKEEAKPKFETKHAKTATKQTSPAEVTESTPAPANAPEEHIMRNEPFDMDQYHAAWQQYYHQYFYRYYANWWQQQQRQQANQPDSTNSDASDAKNVYAPTPDTVSDELRGKIRTTVSKHAKRVSESSHFKPLLGALSVAIIFLGINYNQVIVGAIKQYVSPGNVVTTPVIVEPNVGNTVGPDPKIIIPKIGVEAPVVYDEPRVDENSYQAALERGVVRLGNTANPGTNGNVVIGGHSSNNVFNPGNYKYVFVNLKQLQVNDIFYLHYEGVRYTYKVTVANKIIAPNETSVLNQTTTPTVTLFTCDPPGTNINRLIVQAVQIDPDPNDATVNENKATNTSKTNPLPSVAPSLWDRLFGN